MDALKILLKIPTRGRGLDHLIQWGDNADDPQNIELIVSVDNDEINKVDMWFMDYNWKCPFPAPNLYSAPRVNKIHAFNRDIDKAVTDWDILVVGQDDLKVFPGWDTMIRNAFADGDLYRAKWFDTEPDELYQNKKQFPHLYKIEKGSIHFFKRQICMHPVMGRKLYEKIGFVFNPVYTAFSCDNEYTAVLRRSSLIDWISETPYKHIHPSYFNGAGDTVYTEANLHFRKDSSIFTERRIKHFPGYNL